MPTMRTLSSSREFSRRSFLKGSGEPTTAPVAAAIANAFFDATGVRLYRAPMTPAYVRSALKAVA